MAVTASAAGGVAAVNATTAAPVVTNHRHDCHMGVQIPALQNAKLIAKRFGVGPLSLAPLPAKAAAENAAAAHASSDAGAAAARVAASVLVGAARVLSVSGRQRGTVGACCMQVAGSIALWVHTACKWQAALHRGCMLQVHQPPLVGGQHGTYMALWAHAASAPAPFWLVGSMAL